MHPREYFLLKAIYGKIRNLVSEKLPISNNFHKISKNHRIFSSESIRKKPNKNLKLLFLNYHKKEMEVTKNQDLSYILSKLFLILFNKIFRFFF